IELLLGVRAEGVLVRPGATEALVEGRFLVPTGIAPTEPTEMVLSRTVPADGRSRAYLDGRMATVGALAEIGERLVDLHGQHAHQSLFSGASQRSALDTYAGADRGDRDAARAKLRQVEQAMVGAGGNATAREREMELLTYQLAEVEAAG